MNLSSTSATLSSSSPSSPSSPPSAVVTSITTTTSISIPSANFTYDHTDQRIISFSRAPRSGSVSPSPNPSPRRGGGGGGGGSSGGGSSQGGGGGGGRRSSADTRSIRSRLSSIRASSDDDADGIFELRTASYYEEDDERLASLEALRYALHHAPFVRAGAHTLMSIPDECSLAMQGLPTKCAIRADRLSYRSVLESVTMEVPKGKIYALLGPSGSGKSTLLKLILGRLRPTGGSVSVFSSSKAAASSSSCSSSSSSKSTGCRLSSICVGHMPQEVTLAPELTVGQTLAHYGRLYQLPAYLIEERIACLSAMLHLPGQGVKVGRCNQGQKWRLSLAVALVHSPPLLLLDEPTVMVDPLIRWSVWNRLERLCEEEGLTVLITTQYPEEIGFAYKAGLLRDGTIVAEDRPEELRTRYGAPTYDALYQRVCETKELIRQCRLPSIAPYLEAEKTEEEEKEVEKTSENPSTTKDQPPANNMFPILDRLKPPDLLSYSKSHPKSNNSSTPGSNHSLGSILNHHHHHPHNLHRNPHHPHHPHHPHFTLPMAEWPICERRRTAYLSRFINLDLKRLLALVLKNLATMRGQAPAIALFYFLFPALQIVFMCIVFGRTVRQLPVAVPADIAFASSSSGDKANFGPTFVHGFLDEHIFAPAYVARLSDAVGAVVRGKAVAALVPWTIKTSSSFSSQNGSLNSFSSSSSSSSQQNSQVLNCNFSTSSDDHYHKNPPPPSPPTPFGVKLYLDQSNYVISQTMFYAFISSMRRFVRSESSRLIGEAIWRQNCPQSSSISSSFNPWWFWNHSAPFEVTEVIYGSTRFRFLEFLLPGFLCAIVFSYALVLSAYLFIREAVAGLQERCLATGTSGIELLAAHYISQTALYLVQQALILLIVFRLFGLPSRGPLYAAWLLIFLQGLQGISFGLFIAVICPKPIAAAMITSALFIPAFFFSGIIWPIESMHRLAQHLSHALPLTLPINSLRYILSRGPDMRYSQILLGFSISTGYIVGLLLLTVAIFKCKTSS